MANDNLYGIVETVDDVLVGTLSTSFVNVAEVLSVNGKTGVVVLDAEDVGALPDDTEIPTKTSDLTNDSGFITKTVNDLENYYTETETDTLLSGKAAVGASYTKTESDAKYITEHQSLAAYRTSAAQDIIDAEIIDDIPTKTSDLTNDSGFITGVSWSEVSNKPSTFPPSSHTQAWSTITDKPESYPPSSHTHDDRYYTEAEVDSALSGKANTSHTHTKSQITDFPTIPSKTSDLTNDSGFIDNTYHDATKADASTTYTKTEVDTALGGKVDKVSGKGLSTNDYDDTEKGLVASALQADALTPYRTATAEDVINATKADKTTIESALEKVYQSAWKLGYIQENGSIYIRTGVETWVYSVTEYIPVGADKIVVSGTFSKQAGANIACYDNNLSYLGVAYRNNNNTPATLANEQISLINGTKYIVISTATSNRDGVIIYDNVHELSKSVKELSVPVSPYRTDFIRYKKNLFNKDDATANKYILWETGEIKTGSSYYVSNYIELLGGNTYTINKQDQMCFFDDNKKYLGGVYHSPTTGFNTNFEDTSWIAESVAHGDKFTFTAPSNFKYVRTTIFNTILGSYQIEAGSSITSYEDFQKEIPYLYLPNVAKEPSVIFRDAVFSGKQIKFIGDSITAGVGGTGYDNTASGGGVLIYGNNYSNVAGTCFVNSIKSYIESKFDSTVINFGVSGIGTQNIIDNKNNILKSTDEVVVCMIGTNDRAGCEDVDEFIENLQNLVNVITRDKTLELILMSSLPASVSNETNGTKHFHMEDVDNAIAYVASNNNLGYISLFKLVTEYCESRNIAIDSLLGDGLHPNDTGYGVMFRIVCNSLGIATKRTDATW